MTTRQVQEIKGSEIVELLQNGVTRFKADDEGFGSIEEKYNLTPAGVRRLFKNEELKGLKTSVPEFIFINDLKPQEETPEEVHSAQEQAQAEEDFKAFVHEAVELDRSKNPKETQVVKTVNVFE